MKFKIPFLFFVLAITLMLISCGDGKTDEGTADEDTGLVMKPGDTEVCGTAKEAGDLFHEGNDFYNAGDPTKAVECYEKSLEIRPNVPVCWYNKGLALFEMGDHEGAIECYDEALKHDPEYMPALNNKGAILYGFGKYEEAIDCYDKAIAIDAKEATAWVNKGDALAKLERDGEAKRCYAKAEELGGI